MSIFSGAGKFGLAYGLTQLKRETKIDVTFFYKYLLHDVTKISELVTFRFDCHTTLILKYERK